MKKNLLQGTVLALICSAFAVFAPNVHAQIYGQDDAASYTTGSGNSAWLSGSNTNGGFGFQPWVFTRWGSDWQGFFVGTTTGPMASTNGNYWGMYANGSSGTNAAVAYRAFSNSLPVNAVFKIKWQNLGVGFSTANRAGICLRNGNANSTPADFETGFRFQFYYIGGGQDSFLIYDGSGVTATGLPFSSGPFQIEFILLSSDTYRLLVKDASGSTTLATFDNMYLAGSGTIDSLSLYALQTDGDQRFNYLEVSSTSLVPPEILNLSPTNNTVFATNTTFSFDVVSIFSTIPTSGITLTVNGVNQTNLTITGTSTNRHVVWNSALQPNMVYSGTIIAQDANGNRATNNFTFNTWSAFNPIIEAEDYNYSGGGYLPNAFPNTYNAYAGLLGVNGVDYLEYDPAGTNNAYRSGDLPQVEVATDIDHSGYAGYGYTDYNLGYVQNGEWENYTRIMSNATYAVYARMAGFGNNPVMLIERLATPTATSSNQPRAALGTFVCPQDTGGLQSYTFVPLKDFFSRPVEIRFPGTNTFRCTCIGSSGSYNFNYLILVPSTNTATLRPYISAGFPYPGATAVEPDQLISFTIANRQTAVVPGSTRLFLNGNEVTSGITLSNNAAGTVVLYQHPILMPPGTNTLQAIFSDGTVWQTNQWQFTVASLPVIPAAYAISLTVTGLPGFAIHIAKAPNEAPEWQFPVTSQRAEDHLAGLIINTNTGMAWTNEAGGPAGNGRYAETNVINYNQVVGMGDSGIPGDVLFPYVPPTLEGSYTNDPNYISLEAIAYARLTPGIHKWAVRSDDGFRLWFGTGANPTNLLVGEFEGGRSDAVPSEFEFIVQTNGLYPFRLLYYEGTGYANLELYSINRTNGQVTLINDLSSPDAIRTYRVIAPLIVSVQRTGTTAILKFQTQVAVTYSVQYKDSLTSPTWTTLTTFVGDGTLATVQDTNATSSTRFYRVSAQ